jgi:hypothetical protein
MIIICQSRVYNKRTASAELCLLTFAIRIQLPPDNWCFVNVIAIPVHGVAEMVVFTILPNYHAKRKKWTPHIDMARIIVVFTEELSMRPFHCTVDK